MKRRRLFFLVSFLSLLAAYGIFYVSQQQAVYYYTIPEILETRPQGKVRVAGTVVPGTIVWSKNRTMVEFDIQEPDSGERLRIRYYGIPADSFAPDIEVVASGVIDWQTRTMEVREGDLLVKCPSKYTPEVPST